MLVFQKQFAFILTLLLITFACSAKSISQEYIYTTPLYPWDESFGNHRAVIRVTNSTNIAELFFFWRRHDKDAGNHKFIIINASNGDTIQNINRVTVNNELCHIQFGPIRDKGIYYFYYLPYEVQAGWGFFNKNYFPKEKEPDRVWLRNVSGEKNLLRAEVQKVESRTAFDSFYPMEIIATKAEEDIYLKEKEPFYLFPEDRKFPVRMKKFVPYKWIKQKKAMPFIGTAQPNEFYVFQIGVWAPFKEIKNLQYKVSNLKTQSGEIISAKLFTCFNKEGVDPYGNSFTKTINIDTGNIQALWFGIDIDKNQKRGLYEGAITISDNTGYSKKIPLKIMVDGNILNDRGDSEIWRHSRLRWLNSTLGISEQPIAPYTNLIIQDNQIKILGRNLVLDNHSGLPSKINSWGNEILASPIQFIIETKEGIKDLKANTRLLSQTNAQAKYLITATYNEIQIETILTIEFDGWINYVYTLTPKKNISVKDIRLEIALKNNIAQLFMGAGLSGQAIPRYYKAKWEAPEEIINNSGVTLPALKNSNWLWPFDSFWMGNVHAGIHCELRGSSYSGPLLNLYHPSYPKSWDNNGKGGFYLSTGDTAGKMVVYSGSRELIANNPINFEFAFLLTPVKEINYISQFKERYYHNGENPVPNDEDIRAGIKVINVHHANEMNPVINYPFIATAKMKSFVQNWHKRGVKVKMYYTVRELTNAVTEIWALRSLGDEILGSGKGGGFPWLREHFDSDYTPQWYQHYNSLEETGFTADASILTSTGDSRWYNYYIEGLAWLVKNIDIDGLYLDDVAFDRRILQRMKRAMNTVKPDCFIDLHSNTGFSRGPAIQYAEFFPYVVKLWFGESFLYNKMTPENWLIEVSGIPYGLMGDMLHAGGNRWLGMQYGMTVRQPWMTEGIVVDPRPIWKIWDEFDIQKSKMIGFWETNTPVKTNNNNVKITTYLKSGISLISIGNYDDEAKEITLNYDWRQLGIDSQKAKLIAPEIKGFQSAVELPSKSVIKIEPRKGWLFYLK